MHRHILAGAAMALALAAASPADAQKVIRWGDVVGGQHPSVLMIDRVAKAVKEKTGGKVEIQGSPGGQLGGYSSPALKRALLIAEGVTVSGSRIRSFSSVSWPK